MLCAVQFPSIPPSPPQTFFLDETLYDSLRYRSCTDHSMISQPISTSTTTYRSKCTFIMSSLTTLLTNFLFLAPKILNAKFTRVIQLTKIDWHMDQKQNFNLINFVAHTHTHTHTHVYLYSAMVLVALGPSSASTPSWSG